MEEVEGFGEKDEPRGGEFAEDPATLLDADATATSVAEILLSPGLGAIAAAE